MPKTQINELYFDNNINNENEINKKKKIPKPNKATIDNNKYQYQTPTKANVETNESIIDNNGNQYKTPTNTNKEGNKLNYNNNNKLLKYIKEEEEKETETNEDMTDVFSLFNSIIKDNNNISNANSAFNYANQTIVDIVKLYESTKDGRILIGFVLSNFYGGRHYINNTINKANKLMYSKTVDLLISDKSKIVDKADVAYLIHKNARPIVMVSEIPKSNNIFHSETMEETLQLLIHNFEGKPDQENKGKTFKFNFLPDFILNTIQKKKSFAFICNTITLPDRLTLTSDKIY
jgi:hypothetical protein